jgi:hypothetical protein
LNATGGSVPDNYVFADLESLGLQTGQIPGDPTTFNALDLTLPDTAAAHIPTAPGKNLVSISLAPSSGALGRFGIFVIDRHTFWVDSSNSGGLRSFVNVPIDDGITRIGDVLVTSVADYNRDGIVDAADYTVWRYSLGSTMNLAADGNQNGTIDSGDYDVWKMHFGESALGSGAGASLAARQTVAEPAAGFLLILGGVLPAVFSVRTSLGQRPRYDA